MIIREICMKAMRESTKALSLEHVINLVIFISKINNIWIQDDVEENEQFE